MDLLFHRTNMMATIRIMVVTETTAAIMAIFFLKWKKNHINCWIKKNHEGVSKYIWVTKNYVTN